MTKFVWQLMWLMSLLSTGIGRKNLPCLSTMLISFYCTIALVRGILIRARPCFIPTHLFHFRDYIVTLKVTYKWYIYPSFQLGNRWRAETFKLQSFNLDNRTNLDGADEENKDNYTWWALLQIRIHIPFANSQEEIEI